MKRILFIALALLLMIASAASAESIFTLVTPPPADSQEAASAEPEINVYPSYALMADAIPFTTETLEDGSTRLTFINVADENFLAFGTLLGERGFAIDMSSYTVSGQQQTMTLTRNDDAFILTFDQARHMLAVTYPEGDVLETLTVENPFTDYIELRGGETVKLDGTIKGTFTFGGFQSRYTAPYQPFSRSDYNNYQEKYRRYSWDSASNSTFSNALLFSFNNTGHSSISPAGLINNVVLHYVNTDSHYTFNHSSGIAALYEQPAGTERAYRVCYIELTDSYMFSQPVLSTYNYFILTPYPNDRVAQATDGIIAVTFNIGSDDTNYVYYIRFPGDPIE